MSWFNWEEWRTLVVAYGTQAGLALVHIALILIIGWIARRAVRRGLNKLEDLLTRKAGDTDNRVSAMASKKRVQTLVELLNTVASISIWAIVIAVSLTEVGVDIAPILAGAGIAGLAVGFGAQSLVKDIISGFFFIMEDQVRLGDVAKINGTGGLVEAITFRTITLRDLSGVVHIFPHGQVNTISNMTKVWSAYVLDMGIAYKENPDEAIEVMKEVHAEMMCDPVFGPLLLEELEVFGVDTFADSAVTIKVRLKTIPLSQWKVGREFNRRLKHAFDAKGIEIPFPHRTVFFPEGLKTSALAPDAEQNGT